MEAGAATGPILDSGLFSCSVVRNQSTTLASSVARQIEREIIESGWKEGVLLGNEDDLSRTYGVSRATLREAIRVLGYSSLVEMRRGPGGGLYVRSPPTDAVVETMVVYFEVSDLTLQEICEARQVTEGLAVRLCVDNASDDDIRELEASLSTTAADAPDAFKVSRELARLSSNAALSLFVQALTRLARTRIEERSGSVPLSPPGRTVDVVCAIKARDEQAASQALGRALEDELAEILSRAPNVSGGSAKRPVLERNGRTSLADQVAQDIRRRIIAKGWPQGHVLGSESDILTSYGVSRATLREAVRMLEHHNVAMMRRGPGGGLVVQRPDPSRAIETTCRYLEHISFDTSDLHAIRDAVERATASLAAQRITPVGAARLGEALERERRIDAVEINTVSHTIHAILAELSGNRFLEFCTAVLSRLTGGNVDVQRVGTDLERVRTEVNLIHSRIVDAVVHGDSARAARRMGDHLDAVVDYIDLARTQG